MFDFPTKVDDLTNVPEQFQALYEPLGDEGEGYQMIETLAKKVADLGSLQDTLGKLRKQNAELTKTVRGFTAIAKTPDELESMIGGYRQIADTPEALAELLAEKDKLLEGKDTTKAIEQIKAIHANELKKLTDKFTAELAERDGHLKSHRSALEKEMIESALVAEIARQKGTPELLLPVAKSFVKVMEEDGKFVRRVVDADGDPRVNAKGQPMGIDELITEMRGSDTYARAFDGDGTSGSGSRASGGSGSGRAKKVYTLEQWQKTVGQEKDSAKRAELLREKAAGNIVVRN